VVSGRGVDAGREGLLAVSRVLHWSIGEEPKSLLCKRREQKYKAKIIIFRIVMWDVGRAEQRLACHA